MQEQILQIERLMSSTINANENLLFDSTIIFKGNINYDPLTGVITLNEPGTYEFNWWVATQATEAKEGPIFALVSSQDDFIIGNSPIKAGEIVGFGIIEVIDAPVNVSLKNNHNKIIYDTLNLPVKASLSIIGSVNAVQASMTCFAMDQLANILQQMIVEYPSTSWSLYLDTFTNYFGVPVDLYKALGANGPWLLRVIDSNNNYVAVSLGHINIIYPGNNTVWNPAFTFLEVPDPMTSGCDTDAILGVINYLPLGIGVNIAMGPNKNASGMVYRNEPGVLVLSDSAGNQPLIVSSLQISMFTTSSDPTTLLENYDYENAKYKESIIESL